MGVESEVSGRRLVRNTLANAAGSIAVAILALVLTPFLLRRLGQEQYGVWLLATTLTFSSGYLALADLGFQQAGVRLVAAARASADHDEVNRIVSSLVALFLVIGIAAAVVVAGLAGVLTTVFDIDGSLRDGARQVFLLVGVQVAVDLPVSGFLALIEGAQRYLLLRVVDVGGRVLWAVLVVFAVLRGGGVVSLAVVSLGVAVGAAFAAWLFASVVQPGLRVGPRHVSTSVLRGMAGFGSSLFVLRLLSVLYRQMDRSIIGIALTVSAVARYEVAYKIHATSALVLSVAPSAIMPAAAYAGAAGDTDRLRRLYLRGTKLATGFSLPVTIAGIVYARPIIETWVGPQYGDLTGATRLFLLYPAFVVVHVIGLTMLVGLGKIANLVLLNVFSVGLNLALSVVLVGRFGIEGVILGTLAGYVVLWIPYLRIFLRAFNVGLAEWTQQVVVPVLPAVAAQLLFGVLTLGWAEDMPQLWQVGLVFGVSCMLSVAVFVVTGLSSSDRRELLGFLRRARAAVGTSP